MKRRNFLSGLLAAPLALKARIAQFFVRKPVEPCGAPILGGPVQPASHQWHQREIIQLLAQGFSMKDVARVLNLAPHTWAFHPAREPLLFCSLAPSHKGPHMLLNTR
jgi:hypothetical protein